MRLIVCVEYIGDLFLFYSHIAITVGVCIFCFNLYILHPLKYHFSLVLDIAHYKSDRQCGRTYSVYFDIFHIATVGKESSSKIPLRKEAGD